MKKPLFFVTPRRYYGCQPLPPTPARRVVGRSPVLIACWSAKGGSGTTVVAAASPCCSRAKSLEARSSSIWPATSRPPRPARTRRARCRRLARRRRRRPPGRPRPARGRRRRGARLLVRMGGGVLDGRSRGDVLAASSAADPRPVRRRLRVDAERRRAWRSRAAPPARCSSCARATSRFGARWPRRCARPGSCSWPRKAGPWRR